MKVIKVAVSITLKKPLKEEGSPGAVKVQINSMTTNDILDHLEKQISIFDIYCLCMVYKGNWFILKTINFN